MPKQKDKHNKKIDAATASGLYATTNGTMQFNNPNTGTNVDTFEQNNGANGEFGINYDDDMYIVGGSTSDKVSRLYEDYMSTDDDFTNQSMNDTKMYETYTRAAGGTGGVVDEMTAGTSPTNEDDEAMIEANRGEYGLKVFGMPMAFSPIDDPNRRVYRGTFESDLPVIWINPGTPRVNTRLFGTSFLADSGSDVLKALYGVGRTMVNAAFSMYNIAANPGNRFMNFKGNYKEYYKYVQAIAMSVYQDMQLPGTFSFYNYADKDYAQYGVPFYATGSSVSISESVSNSFQESTIGGEVNQRNRQIRMEKAFAGVNGAAEKIAADLKDMVSDIMKNIPVVNGVVGAFVASLNGDNMQYPNQWTDSNFDRSYNMQFEFYSPYGDPQSIFNFVYLPFIALLCMALPLQDGFYSYKQPFLVRVSSPGWFECECGVITSMSFTRGDDQQWTQEGFPRSIKVSLDVVDLYPSLVQLKNPRQLKYNIGLTSFIETMAGIRYDQLNFMKRANMKLNQINNRLVEALNFHNIENAESDWTYNSSIVTNFLR